MVYIAGYCLNDSFKAVVANQELSYCVRILRRKDRLKRVIIGLYRDVWIAAIA